MKRIALLLVLGYALLLLSCKKEYITPTSADQITAQLQKVITENGITRVIAWDDRGGFPVPVTSGLGTTWMFSNGFIIIYGYGGNYPYQARNLLYLDRYELSNVIINDGTQPLALILHFKAQ